MPANQPIGVFDSGIGGLTVANAINKLMPKEALVYFGDTAHLPYGDKSPEAIKYYSLKIAKFLMDEGCKAIVIACNTASSLAYHDLKLFLGNQIPIYSVIDPVVDFMTATDRFQNIGVIATRATIKSNIYAQKIQQKKPGLNVHSLATPLLVPMIEEGFFNDQISSTLIHTYLSDPVLQGIDSLILGCTHYPLIRNEIAAYYHPEIAIVDNTEIVARHLWQELQRMDLLNEDEPAPHRFYVSDYTDSFEKSTQLFFGQQIGLNLRQIWD
ncbi:MAG: glutamate racemase [Mucilaginibacter sp.]|uniref:glutamate racemase n=1 Tax=Mucilaginibacter sp. TaxID=1882438 RepID=UPI0034E54E0F